jgi:NTP pyrophosphatase (non-canonical NTP hydrolase)
MSELTLHAYQALAAETDRTRSTKPLSFLLLGLFGEVGTLMDEVKKKQRDPRSYVGYEHSVVEELGDVLWYLSNIADRDGLALSAVARHARGDGFSSFRKGDDELTFSSLQPQHDLPFKLPTPEFERTLMGLVGVIGSLADVQTAGTMAEAILGPRLSAVFSLLLRTADEAGVTLAQAAHENLRKVFERWPTRLQYPALFDDAFPAEEQIPRHLEVDVYERVVNPGQTNEKQYVLQRCKGLLMGDRVTDNILEPDDYRFHDVFHLAYVAVLGWSPVIRALYRLKRKSNPRIDESEDGARAVLIDEGVTTFIFAYAKQLEFFDGQSTGDLSFTLLKRIKEFVAGYEVSACPMWLWEKAILDGYAAFRFLRQYRRGRVELNLENRSLSIQHMPRETV